MKVALVTGSAKGLGKVILQNLANQGFALVIHYHRSRQDALVLQAQLQAQKTEVLVCQADLNQAEEVKNMFQAIQNHYGRLDVLVNNVGNYLKKSILDVSITEWNELIQNNLNAVFYCCQSAIPLMQAHQYGRIINIGFAGVGNAQAEAHITPYFIAKNGVLILTKSLAQALAVQNIHVNMVSPGVLENSLSKPVEEIPKGRLATLQEFAETVNFLLSEKADYLTGIHIEVAGGWRL
ncbi:MAG: SDR family oxidoreductase [Microscillaceae bacterium]|jgi:NAD(P)-dependent dehydrogenase (short-subunit alcohol dehydrogenase family)|nr:SDR family oxidoreductase [Microscillaceae bacterium]